jgi:hypothetical protein
MNFRFASGKEVKMKKSEQIQMALRNSLKRSSLDYLDFQPN